MTDQERDQYEERAAILEYDAGFTRDEAERRARVMVCGVDCGESGVDTREPERDLFGREVR